MFCVPWRNLATGGAVCEGCLVPADCHLWLHFFFLIFVVVILKDKGPTTPLGLCESWWLCGKSLASEVGG